MKTSSVLSAAISLLFDTAYTQKSFSPLRERPGSTSCWLYNGFQDSPSFTSYCGNLPRVATRPPIPYELDTTSSAATQEPSYGGGFVQSTISGSTSAFIPVGEPAKPRSSAAYELSYSSNQGVLTSRDGSASRSFQSHEQFTPMVWTEHSHLVTPTVWNTRSRTWWPEMSYSYTLPTRPSRLHHFSRLSWQPDPQEQSRVSGPNSNTWQPTTSYDHAWPSQSSISYHFSQPSWPSGTNEQSPISRPNTYTWPPPATSRPLWPSRPTMSYMSSQPTWPPDPDRQSQMSLPSPWSEIESRSSIIIDRPAASDQPSDKYHHHTWLTRFSMSHRFSRPSSHPNERSQTSWPAAPSQLLPGSSGSTDESGRSDRPSNKITSIISGTCASTQTIDVSSQTADKSISNTSSRMADTTMPAISSELSDTTTSMISYQTSMATTQSGYVQSTVTSTSTIVDTTVTSVFPCPTNFDTPAAGKRDTPHGPPSNEGICFAGVYCYNGTYISDAPPSWAWDAVLLKPGQVCLDDNVFNVPWIEGQCTCAGL